MGCIKNLSKMLAEWIAIGAVFVVVMSPVETWAAFASQFSLGIGEQYSDNIFFSKSKEHDFITTLNPTLSFFYAPPGQTEQVGHLSVTPSGQFFARHSELNNFGKNVAVNGSYVYRYSPKLTFNLSDTFTRQGATRTGSLGELAPLQGGPTTTAPGANNANNLKDVVSGGDQLTNSIAFQGAYLFRPDFSFMGYYNNVLTKFITLGGRSDVFQTIGARAIHNWRQDHNLHAGYSISISNSRNGDSGVIHNFDFGDDYFSNYNLQLTPTLSLTASSGLSFNSGDGESRGTNEKRRGGPRVASNTNLTITKLWEKAVLNAGARKGLTPSFGVSGISDTTSLFANFKLSFTERLTSSADVNWSIFDTADVNFKTFQASMGLQYVVTTWLTTAMNYNFNWIKSGRGAAQTDLLNRGVVNSNSVFIVLTSRFDLWPNIGLARGLTSSALTPVLQTPFPPSSPKSPIAP